MDIRFDGKTVFVTGGSRGIGLSIVNFFKNNGAMVCAPSRSELDLSSEVSISSFLSSHTDFIPDIVVHCAGLNIKSDFVSLNHDDMKSVFQVNYYSIVQLLKGLVPNMKKKGGKIVFVSSLYSYVSKEGRTSYASSKTALLGLCRTLSLELAPFNIMVNCIAPGYVMTDMTKKNLSQRDIESINGMIPTGRFQDEDEISYLIGFVCSDYNRSITGQSIAVDGGFLCR